MHVARDAEDDALLGPRRHAAGEQATVPPARFQAIVEREKADFIDSEGLETLLWLKRRCEDLFGQCKLVNLDENCRKILEITRLEHRFECHDDLTAALKTMR